MARRRPTTRNPAVVFTPQAARRVARAVDRVERGPGQEGAGFWPYRADDPPDGLKLCKTTAAWAKDTSAELKEYTGTAGSETAVTGTATVKAWNKFGDVESGKWVVVGFIDGDWYLLVPEPAEVTLVSGVTLGSGGLRFTRETVFVFGRKTPKPSDTVVSTTACP